MTRSAAPQPEPNLAALSSAYARRVIWKRLQRIWNYLYYIFSVTAIALSFAGAALPSMFANLPQWLLPLMSLVGASIVAFITFCNPAKQARSYIAAWRLLDSKIRDYEREPSDQGLRDIDNAINRGEEILAGKDPF